jgi:phosphoribosylanthranilate isomerase
MALKRIVKVGNITNLSDARYCSGLGVDMLGFQVIEGQENFLPAATFQEIKGWIAGPRVVAELYGIQDATELGKIIEDYQPDLLELGPAELTCLPTDLTLPVIYAGEPNEATRHLKIEFTIPDNGIAQTNIPILTHCDNETQLAGILSNPSINGVVLKGSPEERPGQQDYDHLADILEALEEE